MTGQNDHLCRFVGVDLERITMWRVFENFAARFYEKEQSEYRVRAQTRVDWYELGTRGPASEGRVPIMKPDLLLESEARRVILDIRIRQPRPPFDIRCDGAGFVTSTAKLSRLESVTGCTLRALRRWPN